MALLTDELAPVEAGLQSVILAIAQGVKDVAHTLRTASPEETGTSNQLGDKQLMADIEADNRILDALRACDAVALASSEEQPEDLKMNDCGSGGYSVAFDPLDGSSIIKANWAVGSIFGVWPGAGFVGRTGREMVAGAYAVHGPRTVLVIARPTKGISTENLIVQEFTLLEDGQWALQRDSIKIEDGKKVFAPANLRATKDNAAYAQLVSYWMSEQYTLRYSGGMVPDVHHILVKGGGVFCNPKSVSSPAKLRVLYETLPLAFLVEAAGGASFDGISSALDRRLKGHDDRSVVCLGACEEVERSKDAMKVE